MTVVFCNSQNCKVTVVPDKSNCNLLFSSVKRCHRFIISFESNFVHQNTNMDFADNSSGNYAILGANNARPKNFQETYHPVQQNLKNYKAKESRTLTKGLMITQGMHMPLRLAMEKKVFESVGRLPILKSSHLHTEVLNDTLDTVTERDYLNPAEYNETLVPSFVIMDRDLKF